MAHFVMEGHTRNCIIYYTKVSQCYIFDYLFMTCLYVGNMIQALLTTSHGCHITVGEMYSVWSGGDGGRGKDFGGNDFASVCLRML